MSVGELMLNPEWLGRNTTIKLQEGKLAVTEDIKGMMAKSNNKKRKNRRIKRIRTTVNNTTEQE